MPGTQDLLRRFRRIAAPPGRAAPATVPADRLDERSAELAAVFAAIDEIDGEIEQLEREGAADAEKIRDEGRAEAEEILADAEERAEVARAEAAASQRRLREDEIAAMLARAEERAREIAERSDAQIQMGVARVLDALIGSRTSPASR
jgi:flagellar biosynthesis/type III secretory pathway protein FliH